MYIEVVCAMIKKWSKLILYISSAPLRIEFAYGTATYGPKYVYLERFLRSTNIMESPICVIGSIS